MAKFQLERASIEFFEEALPLFVKHYKEISANQDIPLEINYDHYLDAEESGKLRIYTARDDGGVLCGYSVYFVYFNMRYKSSKQAQQDVLYVDSKKRGIGSRLIDWCDNELRKEGVQCVYHHTKAKPELNFGPMLERKGYQLIDLIYMKRLDKVGV